MAMEIDFAKKKEKRETCEHWELFVDIHNLQLNHRGKGHSNDKTFIYTP